MQNQTESKRNNVETTKSTKIKNETVKLDIRTTILLLFFSLLLFSNLMADEHENIYQKIDSLEILLESIYEVQINVNPYITEEASDWGTGLFGGSKTGTNYTFNIEMGYMFRLNKRPWAKSSSTYIGKRKDYRVGISGGFQMFSNETVFMNNTTFYKSNGFGGYGKLNFGSPILLNFVSFSWHLKAMYTLPENDSKHNITNARMVLGYGNDIEFWLTENACASLGFTDERDFDDDSIYPSKLRFVLGFKTFF